MKIALLHDYFNKFGGGEHIALKIAQAFDADIYTGFVEQSKTFPEITNFNVTEISKPTSNPLIRTIKLMRAFSKLHLNNYDFFIFSGTNCITAAPNHKPNLLYLHTPPRYLYDLKDWYNKNSGFLQRIGLAVLRKYVYPKDQLCMKYFNKICANSKNTKNRILKYYGPAVHRKTSVVYTAVDMQKFRHRKSEDFYISASRLDKLKRIDMIIKAFQQMPVRNLVITGSGPEEKSLKKLAADSPNITFTGNISREKLIDMYSRCRAAIVAAVNEDLGLSAIEPQAAGKPVLAVREGGFLETVIENKTGLFFKPTVHNFIRALEKLEKIKWNPKIIQKNAKRFDTKNFIRNMKNEIRNIMNAIPEKK